MAKITDEEFVAWIEGQLENNFNEYMADGRRYFNWQNAG